LLRLAVMRRNQSLRFLFSQPEHTIEAQLMPRGIPPGWSIRYVEIHRTVSSNSNFIPQREKHFVFEDSKPSSSNIASTALSAQEWLDALDRAREMALAQQSAGPYSAEDAFRDISSGFSSHANTLDRTSDLQQNENTNQNHGNSSGRNHLVKNQATDSESTKGKKRFSRRHSKNGLAAVF
jgi:3-phosphoinositide dependent protein kinase-1